MNFAPPSTNTKTYAGSYSLTTSKKYGDFKYGARTYGETSLSSIGQAMPVVNTREV